MTTAQRWRMALGALASLALATGSFAQSLEGTWEGSITCKDERQKTRGRREGVMAISQPNGPGMGPLYVEWDSARYVGQIFPNDGTAGIGTLVTCTAGPGGYTDVELLRFKVGEDGKGSLKLSGTHASPYSHGPCKGSFVRTSTADPAVGDCP